MQDPRGGVFIDTIQYPGGSLGSPPKLVAVAPSSRRIGPDSSVRTSGVVSDASRAPNGPFSAPNGTQCGKILKNLSGDTRTRLLHTDMFVKDVFKFKLELPPNASKIDKEDIELGKEMLKELQDQMAMPT